MEWIKISAKRETNSGTGLPQKKKKNKQTRKISNEQPQFTPKKLD